MITGRMLTGTGFVLAYRKLKKAASAAQTPTSLAAGMDSLGRAMSTQSVFIDCKTENIMEKPTSLMGAQSTIIERIAANITEQLTGLVSTQTMRIERGVDKIVEKLTALQQEIESPDEQ